MTAADYIPSHPTLSRLKTAVQSCQGCELYRHATQAVFNSGSSRARLMLIGEQPGDEEDRQGVPFVGPAGQLLNKILQEAEIDRSQIYLTNAVKHFKWETRGTRRLHKKPSAREVSACRPWLEQELLLVAPVGIVCLGATAAQALLGSAFRLTRQRGVRIQQTDETWIRATWHPSAILRAPDPTLRQQMRFELVNDLTVAWEETLLHITPRSSK